MNRESRSSAHSTTGGLGAPTKTPWWRACPEKGDLMRKLHLPVLVVVFVLNACTGAPTIGRHAPTAPAAPMRVVILQDISGSACTIPRLSVDDLDRLIAHVAANGGEVAFTTVGESVPALRRLSLAPPPPPPIEVTEKNVLRAARQQAALEKERATYNEELAEFQAANDPRIQEFKEGAAAMLRLTAQETRLHEALTRASLFVQEPSLFPEAPTIVLVISDGKDTSNVTAPVALRCTRLLVVAASSDVGLLNQFRDSITFLESPTAAVANIVGGARCTP